MYTLYKNRTGSNIHTTIHVIQAFGLIRAIMRAHRKDSIKVVLNVNAWIEERGADIRDVELVENQILKCFLESTLSNEHGTNDASAEEEDSHKARLIEHVAIRGAKTGEVCRARV